MEKAFKILKESEYYKQLQAHDECFKKAKEAFEIIGNKFNTKDFLSMNYVITGVEFKYVSNSPMYFIDFIGNLSTEKIKKMMKYI